MSALIVKMLRLALLMAGWWAVFLAPSLAGAVDESGEDGQLPVFGISADRAFPFLIERMRGKKAILLGDATHGTEEYYAFRKRVTRHLIREHGLRTVVLEAEWDGGKLVDDYICGRLPVDTCPRQMLIEAFPYWPAWVWVNEEMVEFVLWLRDFNSQRPPAEMVRVYGMDMQFAVATALAALEGTWPEDSAEHRLYLELRKWWQGYQDYPMNYNFAYARGEDGGNRGASELLASLPETAKEARRRLAMLIAAEEYYRVMSANQYQTWNIRSRHFLSVVDELLGEPAGAKGVAVWAHNSHLGDMSATDVQNTGLSNLGRMAREHFGRDQVFILGSAGYEGTVLASREWYQPPQEMVIPPAAPGSVEAMLYAAGWDNPLLLFEDQEQRDQWSIDLLHRGIGVAYTPDAEFPSYYLTAKIGVRYDALVFWRKTRALRQMMAP